MENNNHVRVTFKEQLKATETEHEEEVILVDEFSFYPSYKAGDTIFLEIVVRGDRKDGMRLRAYRVLDVAHSVRQHQQKYRGVVERTTAYAAVEVFLRKID